MKLTDDISTSPHAAATQVGNKSRGSDYASAGSLLLADRVASPLDGRLNWGAHLSCDVSHIEETNCS